MSAPKPQGFRSAQLQKRDKYQCLYDCGVFFKSRKEAQTHKNCPGRKKSDDEINKMRMRKKNADLSVPTRQPLLKVAQAHLKTMTGP